MSTNQQVKVIIFLATIGWILLMVHCQSIESDEIKAAQHSIPAEIDYNFHVKPILSDRCFKCHGPDQNKIKGDLRLDLQTEAYKATTNESSRVSQVIDPGHLRSSEFVGRILSNDPAYMMPPPEAHLELSASDKAILLRWIEQGAEYKDHWSFAPLAKPNLPTVENHEWAQNELDHFILRKIEEVGLGGAAKATKEIMLRRATLDLTGLPPTVEGLQAFLTDASPDAFERVIDRLLSSPHYGERMAMIWLDLARYADSHGYQDDGLRNTWPWRDWVIDAFNRNLPYDTFLLWQLAGDLLPSPTQEQLLATCFNRNHPQTQEGGVIDEEYRVEYVADRTNTVGKALLGLTMECARCHDHKYDPITQEDYFSLYAYFNNNNDAGIVPYNGEAAPTIILPDDETALYLDSLSREVKRLEATIHPSNFSADFSRWLETLDTAHTIIKAAKQALVADFSFERESSILKSHMQLDKAPKKVQDLKAETFAYFSKAKNTLDAQVWGHHDDRPKLVDGYRGKGVQFIGDAGIRFNRDLDFDRHQPFSVTLWVKVLKQGEEGPIFGKTNGDFEGYRGWLCKLNQDGTLSFQLNHVWPDNAIDIQTLKPIPVNDWVHIAMTYDGSSKAAGVNIYINGAKPAYRLYTDHLHKSLLHGTRGSNWSDQPFLLGMELRKSIKDVLMDELMIYRRELAPVEIGYNYDGDIEANVKEEDLVKLYLCTSMNPTYNRIFEQLTEVRKEHNLVLTDQPEVMVMRERKHPKATFILDRGAYDAPTREVQPRVLTFLGVDQVFDEDRLGLARWLINEQNPLTARVAANRLWSICFGEGLVVTQEDFGSQGDLPSHPQLLDWLAMRLIELDWDIKAFLKEIMMSATYQQSSITSPAQKDADPTNEYFSRYPASRLSAEIIRDQALAGSGLLVDKIGGPSVYPYQPKGIWKALATRNATEYRQQSGDSLYRRSLYTVWKRSSPPPAMLNFDAPDRYYCVVRRQNTSTPLQSLVLMNDPQFVEAARVLAEDMMRLNAEDHGITLAFRRLLGRNPRKVELNNIERLYNSALEVYQRDPEAAAGLLATGEHPPDRQLDPADLAAHTMIASTIVNFDEFVTKR